MACDTINNLPIIGKIRLIIDLDDEGSSRAGIREYVIALRGDHKVHKFVVWERNHNSNTGNWGFYCDSYSQAVENMLMRAGFNDLLDTSSKKRQSR